MTGSVPLPCTRSNKDESHENLSSTLIKILNLVKVDESVREAMRVHESWRSKETENLNSHHAVLTDYHAGLTVT